RNEGIRFGGRSWNPAIGQSPQERGQRLHLEDPVVESEDGPRDSLVLAPERCHRRQDLEVVELQLSDGVARDGLEHAVRVVQNILPSGSCRWGSLGQAAL